jgi:hypothetical protein
MAGTSSLCSCSPEGYGENIGNASPPHQKADDQLPEGLSVLFVDDDIILRKVRKTAILLMPLHLRDKHGLAWSRELSASQY